MAPGSVARQRVERHRPYLLGEASDDPRRKSDRGERVDIGCRLTTRGRRLHAHIVCSLLTVSKSSHCGGLPLTGRW
jgi:hypothetical protein